MDQTENDTNVMGKSRQDLSNNDIESNNRKTSYERICHIVKRPDFDGYGFNLHSEKIKQGQYIGKVDANSPAEAAGLREGDQIIEVNGVNIGSETHKQVVQRIKAISNEVRLLLIDSSVDAVNINSKTQTSIPERNTSNRINNNSTTINKTARKLSTTESYLPEIAPVPNALEASKTSTISTISAPSLPNNTTVDGAVPLTNPTNGHHTSANGQTTETMNMTTTAVDNVELTQEKSLSKNGTESKACLNLNLTAAEMRAKLLAKKKFDPKNETVDLKKKFDIIQKL